MFKAEIIGNLGADAEVKEANGSKFIAMRVAHTDKWTDDAGNNHESTQWIDVTMSDPESKILPYLRQGVKIFVRGNASIRVYSSPTLRKMVGGLTIRATEIELCGGSTDEVPRQLINPEDGSISDVTKHYWCAADTKGLKNDEYRVLVDQKGREFAQNKSGFVVPKQAVEQTEESQQ